MNAFVEIVRRLATENPYNVYHCLEGVGCKYSAGTCTNGAVGCIIGQALLASGVSFEELQTIDDRNHKTVKGLNAREVVAELKLCNVDEAEWCQAVQSNQDCGLAWGRAVELADATDPLTV